MRSVSRGAAAGCVAGFLTVVAIGGCGSSLTTLSDKSTCADWNKASTDARQDYAGQVYDYVRKFRTRLNVYRYVVETNISATCKARPGASLASVKSSCERYVIDCKPIRQPPYLIGGPAQTDRETAQNVGVALGVMETCWLTTGKRDYSRCRDLRDAKVAVGSGPGAVEVVKAGRTRYTIVGHAPSGAEFRLEKRGGGVGSGTVTRRTCSRPGQGPCRADGSWSA